MVVDPALRRKLHAAAKAVAKATEARDRAVAERDRLIRQAVAEGGSLREVGDEVRLSHMGVKKIVGR